ncbi:YrdB family protein [Actinophytocola sp. NPDC049390]|uniref:YrdB family protein n=1 Tax=Actinophytocola sp. NPDC049390 TaxID=3363894 RepID=UPI0037B46E66
MTSPAPVRGAVLLIRFLSELGMLAGLAVAGAHLGGGVVLNIVFAVLLPLAAAALWGMFVAPRARRRLPEPGRFVLEFVLFGVTGLVLGLTGWLVAGLVVAVVGIGFAALTRVFAKDS